VASCCEHGNKFSGKWLAVVSAVMLFKDKWLAVVSTVINLVQVAGYCEQSTET
jgi:hypothetical protein